MHHLTDLPLFHLILEHPTIYISFFFFFNDTATTEIYTLSLHDALPICRACGGHCSIQSNKESSIAPSTWPPALDRKSTRLNSSHVRISYAVFCLKKKKKHRRT